MNHRFTLFSKSSLRVLVWTMVLAGLFAGSAHVLKAQSSLDISSVSISNRSANAVTIDVSTTIPAAIRVLYGTSAAYGSFFPADQSFQPNQNGQLTHSMIIGGLNPSTTYHYKVEIQANGTTKSSADRTFVTTSGSSSGAKLLITDILADCTNASCRIRFSTTQATNVVLKWGPPGTPTANTAAEPTDPPGPYRSGARALVAQKNGLDTSPVRTYQYTLEATDATNQQFTTGLLSFTLSNNSIDHVFTTGACPDGTAINTCNASGAFCRPGGVLEYNCAASCGFICPSGQTCTGAAGNGACLKDPSLNGAPTQCNEAKCYENGRFLNPAASGCYASWSKCNANTILKVRKDRGCNLWLSCSTSVQTEATASASAQNLCLSLAACNSLNQQGQCNKYLPQGQCDNNPLRFCSKDNDCEVGGSCILGGHCANNAAQKCSNDSDCSNGAACKLEQSELTFTTPGQVSQIADLSGSVVAGLDWSEQGGLSVIKGQLPWQLMRQVGGSVPLRNTTFESATLGTSPWTKVPTNIPASYQSTMKIDFEERDNSFNHVLTVDPVPFAANTAGDGRCSNNSNQLCTDNTDCGTGNTCSLPLGACSNDATISCNRTNANKCGASNTCTYPEIAIGFPGVATEKFTASPSEYYYGQVRVRATKLLPKLRVQFGSSSYTKFTSVDVTTTSAWQTVSVGPIRGIGGDTQFAIVCADAASCRDAQFQIDDIQIKPVLQVNTNPEYITPSCRLFPKNDSPACDYTDANGTTYRGWHGYCLETDSQTGTCLSWWPVDILKGETNVFGSDTPAGYNDQSPLYYCAETFGLASGPRTSFTSNGNPVTLEPYQITENRTDAPNPPASIGSDICNYGGNYGRFNGFKQGINGSYTIGDTAVVTDNGKTPVRDTCAVNGSASTTQLTEDQISSVNWISQYYPGQNPGFTFVNNEEFQQSSFGSPVLNDDLANCQDNKADPVNGVQRICHRIYRTKIGNEIYWRYHLTIQQQYEGLNINGIDASLVFDAATHVFKRYEMSWMPGETVTGLGSTQDSTTAGWAGAFYQVVFHTREICSKVVQVVNPGGRNQAFVSRVSSNSYKLQPLNYSRATDLTPYGAILPPADQDSTPNSWPALPAEQPNYSRFQTPGQARSGSPYACIGDCSKLVCDADNTNHCDTNQKISTCQAIDINGDGEGDGQCIGVASSVASNKGSQTLDPDPVDGNAKYFAELTLRRLFAQTYGVWNYKNGQYVYDQNSDSAVKSGFIGWNPPTEICPKDSNGKYVREAPDDYCAIPPEILPGAAFLSGKAPSVVITGGSGSVGIKFNTQANADQLPLEGFTIDWGDTTDTFSYPFAPKNDPRKPHIFSHAYVCDNGATCTYLIKIQVKDNWGWCNDAKKNGAANALDGTGDTQCQNSSANWYNTDLKVTVRP